MLPVVTPDEMRAIDAAAADDIETLIERAGWATAAAARRLLGTLGDGATPGGMVYGRRVAVLAGPGNNGADGRVAARLLGRWGAKVEIVDARTWRQTGFDPNRVDLVIDAAFGTGLRRPFDGPHLDDGSGSRPLVLAVDIPSGLDGETGTVYGSVMSADATVTFGAHKPGLLVGEGPSLSGHVMIADLGLDTSSARIHLLEANDLSSWPSRPRNSHKWHSAVWVIGGRPSMPGAPRLAAMAVGRAGAGYVLGSIPGLDGAALDLPVEAVGRTLGSDWGSEAVEQSGRVATFLLGPGLPTDDRTAAAVRHVIASTDHPLVIDAGAIDAVSPRGDDGAGGPDGADPAACLRERATMPVLTPHDGEFARLMGGPPGPDRIESARRAATALHSVVLLKGPTTIVAAPDGRVLLSTAGDARLATAGTGDVLSGIIAAGLALGLDPFLAAGLGAEVHGHAAALGFRTGLIAGDLPALVAAVLSGRPSPDLSGERAIGGAS